LPSTIDSSIARSATVTIEPRGPRTDGPREHLVRVTVRVRELDQRQDETLRALDVARAAMEPFVAADGPDGRSFQELRSPAAGKTAAKVIAIQGEVIWPDEPDDNLVARVVSTLTGEGYAVGVRKTRECSQPACLTAIVMDWTGRAAVPRGWHTQAICEKHPYKRCVGCGSTYLMSSVNAAGQAESVHCEVCGAVMIEWGSSKVWHAELVSRGEQQK
jgi:hypothetical protein